MILLDDNIKKDLLAKYPEKYHDLLLKQILAIQDTIEQYQKQYQTNQGFQVAMNIILNDIVQGKYLGRNPMDD